MGKSSPFSNSLERHFYTKSRVGPKTNVNKDLSKPVTPQILPQREKHDVRNMNVIKPRMYRIDTRHIHTRPSELPHNFRNLNPRVSTSTGVIHNTSVSRLQLRSTKMKDKVVQNNSQGNELLMGTSGYDLYTIALQESSSPTPICLTTKASPTQAWLWHHRLSHLNFDTINILSKNDIV
nr:integrase, catalytic region, zinc finger, CCHC-type, peptidase aspartic, catalytic [Tanacetum cinerariifolium]